MITLEMIILDIVEKYPETEDVFRTYDSILGKCLLCNCLFDSVKSIVDEYNLNSKELIDKLNSVIK